MPRYYRVQPKGLSLFGHRSRLGTTPVGGVFAYSQPETMFGTYSWLYIQKRIPKYEMIEFDGRLVEQPEDSEGVVVEPVRELARAPLRDWMSEHGYAIVVLKR